MATLDFECVEPELGEQLHLLADGDLDPVLRERLERHLTVCHACRELRRFEALVASDLGPGVAAARTRVRNRRWAGVCAAGVIVALLLLFMLPPRVTIMDMFGKVRSAASDSCGFVSPLEGEVLRGGRTRLRWDPVENARAYDVRVEVYGDAAGGDAAWESRVRDCEVRLPESMTRPGAYLAIVKPQPNGVWDDGEMAVGFVRSSLRDFVAFRFRNPPQISIALLVLALLAGTIPLWRRR